MHKELIICIVVVVVITVLDIFTQNFTNESIAYMDEELSYLKENLIIDEVDKDLVDNKMKEIYENWEEKKEKLAYYIEHDELEKVNTELSSLKANILVEEYSQGVPNLEMCKFILNHIKEKTEIKIKNIF